MSKAENLKTQFKDFIKSESWLIEFFDELSESDGLRLKTLFHGFGKQSADEQNELEVDTILKLKAKLKEAEKENKNLLIEIDLIKENSEKLK